MQLIYDRPASVGVENALKRARRLCEIGWTPVRPLPSALFGVKGTDQEYFYGYFQPWRPQKGIPYSSCRTVEKYVGWNISPETFLTALQNPHSVVYTRQLKDEPGTKANSYYGLVCSMFVSYALELPYRIVCKDWAALEDIHAVTAEPLENLRLGDILLDPKRHVALITGLARDEAGAVQRIEVSECTLPLTVCTAFTPEEFRRFWLQDHYGVYRYGKIDQVTYTPDPWMPLEGETAVEPPHFALLPDYGNKANYRVGDEPVELWALEEGWEAVEVTHPDGKQTCHPLQEGHVTLQPAAVGHYSACLVREGARSGSVEWRMVSLHLQFEKETYAVGEPITCRTWNEVPEEKVFHAVLNTDTYYVKDTVFLTEEEGAAGRFTLPAQTVPGKYFVIAMARNEYGVYTSPYCEVTVEEEGERDGTHQTKE